LSDEFLRVAKEEVSDDIAKIGSLLKNCSADSDISKNAAEIEKHTHKLKGLAPMMGQSEIGDIASVTDAILKAVISGKHVPDILQTIKKSHRFMLDAINNSKSGYDLLKNDLNKKYSEFLSRK
jgi:chemotaxis protein histidine kinase CheA